MAVNSNFRTKLPFRNCGKIQKIKFSDTFLLKQFSGSTPARGSAPWTPPGAAAPWTLLPGALPPWNPRRVRAPPIHFE
ncbi:hypothetical protein HanRHA438_Chr04g0193281 [Helianthus annuus]|nr:hypothetical protein HanRHA438_Chr04g0193281 [Helianthus annuus]